MEKHKKAAIIAGDARVHLMMSFLSLTMNLLHMSVSLYFNVSFAVRAFGFGICLKAIYDRIMPLVGKLLNILVRA